MKITDALLGEHGVIYAVFDHLERELPNLETLGDVQRAGSMLKDVLGSHAGIENDLLFPALDPHLGPAGPLTVMRGEREEFEGTLGRIAAATTREDAAAGIRHIIEVARDHFAKEERILFGMAQQALAADELEQLAERWSDVRRVVVH